MLCKIKLVDNIINKVHVTGNTGHERGHELLEKM
jgi:hypothetical protein